MEPLLEQMGGWGYHWQRKGWLVTHSQIETEFEQVSAILGGIQESASTMINTAVKMSVLSTQETYSAGIWASPHLCSLFSLNSVILLPL